MLNSLLSGGGRISTWFARAASFGIALMMVITVVDVIGRAFNHPIIGSIEFTETILAMTVFLGMGYVTIDRSHITVDFVVVSLPKKTRAALLVVTGLIGVVFIGFATWRMILQTYDRHIENLVTTLWKIPMWPITFVMALGLTLMMVLLVLHWVQDAGDWAAGKAPSDKHETPHGSIE
jgi:TRAP-type C4-dicarboxylate transport system permease small subunit